MPCSSTANVAAPCQRLPCGWRLRMPCRASEATPRREVGPAKWRRLVGPTPQVAYSERSGSATTWTPWSRPTAAHQPSVGSWGEWVTATHWTSGYPEAARARPRAVASANGQPVWRRKATTACAARGRRARESAPGRPSEVGSRRRSAAAEGTCAGPPRSLSAPGGPLAQSPLGGAQPAAHPQPPARDHRVVADRPRVTSTPRSRPGRAPRAPAPRSPCPPAGHGCSPRPRRGRAGSATDRFRGPPWRECPARFGRDRKTDWERGSQDSNLGPPVLETGATTS